MKWSGRAMRRRRLAAAAVAVVVVGVSVASASASASDDVVEAGSGAFSDDDGSVHEAGLDALAARGFLDGTECAEGRFCPTEPLKRWEMAVWLGRALRYGEPEPVAESRFADVDAGEWWAPHVERFADLGIAAGCRTEPLDYCPEGAVSRAEMATFLRRALRLPAAASAGFADTAGNPHEDSIDVIAAEGIAAGCATGPLRYCPDSSVTRAQTATLMSRAFGLIPALSGEPLSAQEVYARVAPSIPIVLSREGQGSGILIPGDYVLTNHHVVWPNELDHTATVMFADGTEHAEVPVVATNPWADLALLGPLQTGKRPLPLADGEQLPLGSDLYLVGYPAEYEPDPEPTITRGLLSRVRHWDGYDLTLLQTDAVIAGGQSGGALIDGRGRVVGVSTWEWHAGGFGIATSAIDDANLIDLMLTEPARNFSLRDRVDTGDEPSRAWEFELGGTWDTATFVVAEAADAMDVRINGPGTANAWLADPFEDRWIWSDGDGLADFGPTEVAADGPYFVEVSQASTEASSYTLDSSAALLPYRDEDGRVLLAAGQTRSSFAGVVDYFNDLDVYRLELRRGETVEIRTDSVVTDTGLLAYDPASDFVAEDDDSGPIGPLGFQWNAEISFEAPSTGTYYVRVYVAGFEPGGSYLIHAAIVQ